MFDQIRQAFWKEVDSTYALIMQTTGALQPLDPTKYRFLNAKSTKSVLLLPGKFDDWQLMQPIAQHLAARGYRILVPPKFGKNNATQRIGEFIKTQKLDNLVVVAHDKGNTIGKELLANKSLRSHVTGLVTLGTPSYGLIYTWLVPFARKALAPSSPTLSAVMQRPEVRRKIVSLYSLSDPRQADDAGNIRLPVYGHYLMMRNARVHTEIEKQLERFFSAKASKQAKKRAA